MFGEWHNLPHNTPSSIAPRSEFSALHLSETQAVLQKHRRAAHSSKLKAGILLASRASHAFAAD
jgi:hypothetical protein